MKNKRRVALFADMLTENMDGSIRTIYQILSRIPTSEFEFLLITGKKPIRDIGIPIVEIPSMRLPLNKHYLMALPFLIKQRLDSLLGKFSPDIIHFSNPSLLGKYAMNYSTQHDLPLVSIYHTHYPSYVKYYLRKAPMLIPMVRNRLVNLFKQQYTNCDRVYIPSESIMKDFQSWGYRVDNCDLWQRGMDTTLFNPNKKDLHFIQNITGNNKVNVLFASRIVWEKNLKTLISIYNEIEKESLPYNLIIAGDGHAKSEIEKRMPNAYFTGNLPHKELSILYASADTFLFPSDSETYGNVVIEAMASGCPCVVADSGGPSDIVENGFNGFKSEPYDSQDYLQKLKRLLDNKTLRSYIIRNGLEYTKSLSWKSLTDRYFSDLKSLASDSQLAYA